MELDLEAIARAGVQHRLATLKLESDQLRQWLKTTKKKKFFAGIPLEGAGAQHNGEVVVSPVAGVAIAKKMKKTHAAAAPKRKMSAKARKAISMAQKARWAKQKAAKA